MVIQKFGGTSIASPALRERVVEHILRARAAGRQPVVVVSAMGRAGDPYATDTLLELAGQSGGPLQARELDLLLACGEIISCTLLAQALAARGHPAQALTGGQAGILTDDTHGNARILEVRPERVLAVLKQGEIPVIAGFQGATRTGEVTTLGRGGSDTTASALGVVLGAEVVEIYTDVDGVKTADPRLVPDAATLAHLGYQEVAELAHLGARVIHPRAVEIAMAARLPLRILATQGGGEGGTAVGAPPLGSGAILGDRVVTGIAHVPGRAQVVLAPPAGQDFNQGGLAVRLLQGLAAAGVSLDMIQVSPERVAFVIDEERQEDARDALAGLDLGLRIQAGYAKVSVVGGGMHGVPGVMARVAKALAEARVPIYQTADSHANISCLVRQADVEQAVRALHQAFALGRAGQAAESQQDWSVGA